MLVGDHLGQIGLKAATDGECTGLPGVMEKLFHDAADKTGLRELQIPRGWRSWPGPPT